jgi:N-carbamoyl-L-amino-acid hydrolase
MTLRVDEARLRERFESYSEIGATENGGLHRLALSEADRRVRDRFVSDLESLDLDVHVDELGNVFGRREGTDPDADPVLVGSHLDSQPFGGRYDGQLGVLVALEALATIEDADAAHRRPIEIVDWTNEEGSRFQPGALGSKTFTGAVSVEEALAATDADGETVAEALEEVGYAGDVPCRGREIHANLELHVEQSTYLDDHDLSVGVVEGGFGLRWFEVTVDGEADHAGSTPMHARSDAFGAAVDAIANVRAMPGATSPDAVATVGRVECHPNSVNVIPGRVTFTVDVRSFDPDALAAMAERVEFEVATACDREGTTYEMHLLNRHEPLRFSDRVVEAVEDAAASVGAPHARVVSGAGHDAMALQSVTDSGMVFVPSVDGETHNESEFTEWGDVVAGANVFVDATLSLAE